MTRPGARALLFAAAASPAFLALWIVFRYGVDVPYMDDWAPGVGGAFVKLRQGGLALADVLAQHNEHRMVVPRLVMLGVGLLTDWNMRWAMFVAWLITCVTSVGILRLGSGTRPDGTADGAALFRWFLCNLLIFTPALWDNWLWAMGIANVLPAACLVLGALVLGSKLRPWLRLSVALLLATAATFSTASGGLAWPILGFLLARHATSRSFAVRLRMLAVWVVAFAVNVLLFVWNYAEPPHPPGVDAYFASVPRLVHYTLVFLGSTFAGSSRVDPVTLSGVAGGVMVLILAATIVFCPRSANPARDPDARRRMWTWAALGTFAIGSGAGVALFRAGFGAEQAISSRYITYAAFLPIALIHLVPLCLPAWRRLPAFLAGALLVLQLLCVPAGLHFCATTCTSRRQSKAVLLALDMTRDDARLIRDLCFEPPSMVPIAHALNDLGCLRPPLIRDARASPQGVPGKLEGYRRTRTDQCTVLGWASNPRRTAPADGVLLVYDDGQGGEVPFALADMGVMRADLPEAQHDADLLQAGWVTDFPLQRLPAGKDRVLVRAWAIDSDTGTLHRIEGEAVFGTNPGR